VKVSALQVEMEARERVIKSLHGEAVKWMDRFALTLNGDCRNLPFGGRATRDSRDACSMKGIRAESPPTFI